MRGATRRLGLGLTVILLLAAGILFGSSQPEAEAQRGTPGPSGPELSALCINQFTRIVFAPTPLTVTTCPAFHSRLLIPDHFPFVLSVNPWTGTLTYNSSATPGPLSIVMPDDGTVQLCASIYTRQLRTPIGSTCPGGTTPVLLVGEFAPEAVDDGYTMIVDTTLTEPVPGLLGNDELGIPAATLVSFGGGPLGDVTANPAGATVVGGFAGGDLTVNADGSFSVVNPTMTGSFSFEYRLENVAGFDDATVTIEIQQAPDAVNDGPYTTEPGVTLSVTTAGTDLLENDTLGFPEAQIVSISGGDLTGSFDAGDPADLAGGTLTVNADGSFELANPVQTGSFSFDYLLENDVGSDTATVTIQIDAPPTVMATTPVDAAVNVAVDSNLTITFNEPVTPTGDWIEIVCATSGSYNPTGSGGATVVNVTDADPLFTLDPASDFASAELCTVTIVASLVSDDDTFDPPDTMEIDHVFSFTTDAAPQVTGTTPPDGAVDVPVDSDITVSFSEDVTVTGSWFTISCTTSGNHTATVSGGSASFTLDPNANLVLSETCTVTLAAGQISDQDSGDPPDTLDGDGDGVSEGSPADDYSFSFTTPDAPPQVESTVPTDAATSVAVDVNLTITFTEPVNPAGDWFVINCGGTLFNPTGSGGATVVAVTDTDPVYTLDPQTDLPGGVTCAVTITADLVSDDDAIDPPDTLDGDGDDTSEGSPADDYSFSFGTVPVAVNDSYASLGNVGNVVDAAGGVILGAGADEGSGLSVSEVQGSTLNVGVATTTDLGGRVTLDADGSFSYDPPPGDTGDDTFSYRVSGASGTSNLATVTVSISDMLWFIDNGAGGSSNLGTLTNPFTSIDIFNARQGGGRPNAIPGDTVFIHTGSGDYTTGIELQSNQLLIGQAAGDSIENISSLTLPPFSRTLPATGGIAPTLTTTLGNGINLGANNVVRGLDVGDTSGIGLRGGDVGTLFVREVSISGNGGGVNLFSTTGSAIDVALDSLSANSTNDQGIRLEGVSGSFAVTAIDGTLSISNASAVYIVGAANPNEISLDLTFASITANGGMHGVLATNAAGSFTVSGNVDIDNTIDDAVRITDSPATFDFQGTTSVDNAGINGINLSGASNGPITFASVDLDAIGSVGLRIQNNNDTVSVNGGSIGATNDPGGNAVDIDGGNANITIAASVTKTSGGDVVNVAGRISGTSTFSGALSCASPCSGIDISGNGGGEEHFTGAVSVSTGAMTGVNITNNAGSHLVMFSGGLDIDTTSGTGFNATGSGTVEVLNGVAANTVGSGSGTAVNIIDVTIGAQGVTFESISANGAASGIIISNAGSGGFTVAGDGATGTGIAANNDSGGSILNATGDGISLTNVSNVSLNYMRIQDAADNGIDATSVTNLTITRTNLVSNGTANQEHGFRGQNLSGNVIVNNTLGDGNFDAHLRIFNESGNDLTLFSVDDGVYQNVTTGFFEDGISFETQTNVTSAISVTNSTFANHDGDHIQASSNGSANMTVTITGNTMTGAAGNLGAGITVNSAGNFSGTTSFTISNNNIQKANDNSTSINVNVGLSTSAGAYVGTIADNVIGTTAIDDSAGDSGIAVEVNADATMTVLISNNTIREFDNFGIDVGAVDGTGAVNATITGNTATSSDSNAFAAMFVDAQTNNVVCVDVGGASMALENTFTASAGFSDVAFQTGGAGVINLEDYGGAANSQPQIEAYVQGRNAGSPGVQLNIAGGNVQGGGSCPTP